jgi:anti-sigma-K factor RskA
MEAKEYIESGILELYVFGTLTETENNEILEMSKQHSDIANEILSIEKAVISLSYSMAPYLSASNFDKIKNQLLQKHQGVIQMQPKSNTFNYLGWVAAVLLLVGTGYFYNQNQVSQSETDVVFKEKAKINIDLENLKLKTQETELALAVVRDDANTVIALGGQAVAPTAKAKIYWNKLSETVYVDASGLPEPPEGKEYQIWSLKLVPTLTPTSIGMLSNFKSNNSKIFAVQNTNGAEAFGITLEPKGGSPSPSMEQLYTLGKV